MRVPGASYSICEIILLGTVIIGTLNLCSKVSSTLSPDSKAGVCTRQLMKIDKSFKEVYSWYGKLQEKCCLFHLTLALLLPQNRQVGCKTEIKKNK